MTGTALTVHLHYLRDITILADDLSRVASKIARREQAGSTATPIYNGLLDKRELLLQQLVKLALELRAATPTPDETLTAAVAGGTQNG